MPWINLILDQHHGKTLFTALDIRDGYNNICIRDEDQWKLVFKGPGGVTIPLLVGYVTCFFYFSMTLPPLSRPCMTPEDDM
jgi:hypothetical protein